MNVRKKCNKSAFTLVELLVVIAIIAILLSILMPSLRKVREQARKVICAVNLRSCGVGQRAYAQDNNGYLSWSGGWHSGNTWLMYHWGNNDPVSGPWYGFGRIYAQGYLENGKVFFCPHLRVPADIRKIYTSFNGSTENCAYVNRRVSLGWDETEQRLDKSNMNAGDTTSSSQKFTTIMSSYPLLLNYNPHNYPEGQYPQFGPKGWKWEYCQERGNLTGKGGMAIAFCSYEYWATADSRIIPPNHKDGTNVLYLGGSVKWWTSYYEPLPWIAYSKAAQELYDELKVGSLVPFDRW